MLCQLSYTPDKQSKIPNFRFQRRWLRGRDLNPRPLGYEPNELPDCSTPRQDHFKSEMRNPKLSLVGLGRFELPTSRLSGVRSNQLSYRPISSLRDFAAKKSHTSRSAVRFNGGRAQGRVASVAKLTIACDLLQTSYERSITTWNRCLKTR